MPIQSQAFGSIGAVVAWFRTSKLLQVIMERLFGLLIFCYVDDCFWTAPKFDVQNSPGVNWIAQVFEYVVTYLLGWKLDPEKSCTGELVTLLGLEVSMQAEASYWKLSSDKAEQWVEQISRYLSMDRLTPTEASKLSGRIAFLNTHVFGRLGRALLRPIIWRQIDTTGSTRLTKRLRWSLIWFRRVLQEQWQRRVPYSLDELKETMLIYTDAESNGYVATVMIASRIRCNPPA